VVRLGDHRPVPAGGAQREPPGDLRPGDSEQNHVPVGGSLRRAAPAGYAQKGHAEATRCARAAFTTLCGAAGPLLLVAIGFGMGFTLAAVWATSP
jgi:hypothetical protein